MRIVRRSSGALVLAALAVAVAGCATAAVKTKQEPAEKTAPSFDASGYRTYEWGTSAPEVVADQERERDAAVLEYTVRNAVDQQLAAKGYQRIEAGSPDFVVDFGIRLEEKSTDTFGEYITYRDAGGHQDLGPAYVFGYEESSLVVQINDARSGKRIWRGAARTVLDDGQDVTKLESSVARLLTEFPSRPGSPAATAPPVRKPSEPKMGDIHVPEP
jgi:hypothetical protein